MASINHLIIGRRGCRAQLGSNTRRLALVQQTRPCNDTGHPNCVIGNNILFGYLLPDPEHSAAARWVLAVAYVVTGLCWLRARRRAAGGSPSAYSGRWLLGAILLFLLAANKVFQLRVVFEAAFRAFAKTGHWYDRRQPMQFVLAMVVPAVLGMATAIFLLTRGRKFARAHLLGLMGWALLLLYLGLRQTQEWKPILQWLEWIHYYDWRFGLEAAGIGLTLAAGLRGDGAAGVKAKDKGHSGGANSQ